MSKKSIASICAVAACSLIVLSASAAAAPTLTLSTGADPVESVTTQVIAMGSSGSSDTGLSVTVKPTGGQGCAANFEADRSGGGETVFQSVTLKEGPFTESTNETFSRAGSYLLCGWLNDFAQSGSPVVATAFQTVAVRPPHLLLTVSAPSTVSTGQAFQIATTAQAEVNRYAYEFVLPSTGRGCPANAGAASSASGESRIYWPNHGSSWGVNGGPFSESVNETLRTAGQYLVCAYVEYPSEESPPEISASATVTAVSPPPPCIVPSYSSVTRLHDAEQAIRASGCAVGKVRRVASRRIRAGYVIGLGATPGTHFAPGTPINMTVSTGPPCIVPFVAAGTTLGRTELRLLANHCAVGKVSLARSRRVRHGRVVRLGARTGQVLASHTPIAILLSRRRR
ncbi:MAG TPA: hypothetical protein VMB05_05235 [Solirubrobacteraceae bacterium]|nr:hypothetical protein [Solirubrobacteraceae bacterium]